MVDRLVEDIYKVIKKGEELVTSIQFQLMQIMWKNCGVIKNKELLEEGIRQVEILEERLKMADIRTEDNDFKDLN